MAVNKALLMATMERVKKADRRGLWDQGWWRGQADCGTTYCFAGWACIVGGVSDDILTRMGYSTAIPETAISLLGISESDGMALFAGHNSLEDLQKMVCGIVTREEEEENADQ